MHLPGVPIQVPSAPGPHAVLTGHSGRPEACSRSFAAFARVRSTGVVSQHPSATKVHSRSALHRCHAAGSTTFAGAAALDGSAAGGDSGIGAGAVAGSGGVLVGAAAGAGAGAGAAVAGAGLHPIEDDHANHRATSAKDRTRAT